LITWQARQAQTVTLNDSEMEGLLTRARLMDPQALGELHDLCYPLIYRYIFFLLDDIQVVQDLTTLILQDLLSYLLLDKSTKGKIDGWLLKSADKQVQAYLRQNSVSKQVELNPIDEIGLGSPDNENPKKETTWGRQIVKRALRRLDTDQQRFLALRFILACSPEEIATLTGSKLSRVKTLQYLALQSLRRFLEAEA
jgi:RNA polymerase sigma-70 factor (ECF subfamily)